MSATMRRDTDAREAARDELFLLALLGLIRRHARLIAGGALVGALTVGLIVMLLPRTWTIRASFLPVSGQSSTSGLAGLAAQFGVQVPGKEGGDSPALFTELLSSRDVLVRIVDTVYTDSASGETKPLTEWLEAEGSDSAAQLEDALHRLKERLAVRPSRETGVVSIAVQMEQPAVALQVVSRLIRLVEDFNVRRRQVLAAAEERFVGERLQRTGDELRQAEEELEQFLARNRSYQNSPQLALEWERLQRKVQMRQEIYSGLMQMYEQARIDAVRNTPVIAVIDPPQIPGVPDRRRLALKAAAGAAFGMILVIAWTFLKGQAVGGAGGLVS
jgi:uncharacterized protein involved in exopolysaccharide biosynthesis